MGVYSARSSIYSQKVAMVPTLFKPVMVEARPVLEDNLTKAETHSNLPFV